MEGAEPTERGFAEAGGCWCCSSKNETLEAFLAAELLYSWDFWQIFTREVLGSSDKIQGVVLSPPFTYLLL